MGLRIWIQRQLILGATALLLTSCGPTSASLSDQPETKGSAPTPPVAPATIIVTPTPAPVAPSPAPSPAVTSAAPAGSALAAVDSLVVKGRAPKTGYSREQFGEALTRAQETDHDNRKTLEAFEAASADSGRSST